ncbi:MAG: hypothetical protein U5L01_03020 [Rheinheimera sp.]|nr:hypothetical protein [Rheinheimera sp.]
MIKYSIFLVIMSILLGCNSTSSKTHNDMLLNAQVLEESDEASEKICFHEKILGSNRKALRCTTKAEQEKSRQVSREAWLRQQQGSVKTGD